MISRKSLSACSSRARLVIDDRLAVAGGDAVAALVIRNFDDFPEELVRLLLARARVHAAELVALAPDVLVAGTGTATVAPLLQATRTVPIVFVLVIDPVGAGFVASLARPGGNATGFRFSNTA